MYTALRRGCVGSRNEKKYYYYYWAVGPGVWTVSARRSGIAPSVARVVAPSASMTEAKVYLTEAKVYFCPAGNV